MAIARGFNKMRGIEGVQKTREICMRGIQLKPTGLLDATLLWGFRGLGIHTQDIFYTIPRDSRIQD